MDIEKCKADIKRHEGEVLEIYEDSLGYKTLGVGHLCQPGDPEYDWEVGTPVSQEVVDMYYDMSLVLASDKANSRELISVYLSPI